MIARILAVGIVFSFALIHTSEARAQTFNVLYSFTGGADGSQPFGGVAMDAIGNLYGTTYIGGYTHHPATAGNDCYPNGCGMIFRLTKSGSTWMFTSLYAFVGGADGDQAIAPLAVGPDGAVYGTARFGGTLCYHGRYGPLGCGIVYKISTTEGGGRRETILYRFKGAPDGEDPWNSPVTFDSEGNIYLTTFTGGVYGGGTAVELLPAPGEWSENILHSFLWPENEDGLEPDGGLIFDNSGRLYGTTFAGGTGDGHCLYCGTVYQLTPSDLGWAKRILYTFRGGADGETPLGGLVFDPSGRLYGTTNGLYYPSNNHPPLGTGGCVFMLTPSGDDWNFEVLHSFIAPPGYTGAGPNGKLALDASGNIYGTTFNVGAYAYGSVFKLSPSANGWTFTTLHDFTGGSDGKWPSGLIIDAQGNLYGTAWEGGPYGGGLVWEIIP
jgi:uncharacterized repeat protein (TIGR03803 family)